MTGMPWVKIWWTWYTSRSHIGLSGIALALGAPLMLICRAAAERHSDGHGDGACDDASDASCDIVWIKDKAGKPIAASHIANVARFPVDDVRAALDELVVSGTLVLSADGVYGFPNFWRYQESAAAARTRKYRGRKQRHTDRHTKRHSDGHSDGACDDKREEGRDNRESARPEGDAVRVKPAARKPRSRTERDDWHDAVCLAFEAAHKAAHGVPHGMTGSLVAPVVSWLLGVPAAERQATLQRAVDGFFASEHWAKAGKHPLHAFSKAPGSYVTAAPAPRSPLRWVGGMP